jgi:hypothetical protein
MSASGEQRRPEMSDIGPGSADAQGRKMPAWLHVIGVNLGLLLAGIVAVELIFGQWLAPYHPPSGAIFGRTFKLEQHYYRPHKVITYVRDRYGLRGSSAPIGDIELVTVGGSTTDQIFITEGETFQDIIHARTGLRVTNAGDEGISSTGHIVAVEDWLHRIPDLRPRFYLHYIGVNDAAFAYLTTLPGGNKVLQAQIDNQKDRRALHRIVRGRSALIQGYIRLRDWWGGPPKIFEAPDHGTDAGRNEIKAEVDGTALIDYIERIYKPNVRRLLELHQERNEKVILVSQPGRPSAFRREGSDVWVRNPGFAGYAVALSLVNDATGALCHERPGKCYFIDLASELAFENDDFYDNVHTTPAGARRIGEFLSRKLLQIMPVNAETSARER